MAQQKISAHENKVHEFTVLFAGDHMIVDGRCYPLGHFVAEVLNLPAEVMSALAAKGSALIRYAKRNPEQLLKMQEKLNGILDDVFELPFYRDLDLDAELTRSLLPRMQKEEPETFALAAKPGTREHDLVIEMILRIAGIGAELIAFAGHTSSLLDVYLEYASTRSAEGYAQALRMFFSGFDELSSFSDELAPLLYYSQSANALLEFSVIDDGGHDIIAERMVFTSIGDFLRTEFFRALQHGNAPRRCHNCGRFFLLTAGYNTCYCNNIAPDEAERTCRKVGAHKKAATRERTPAQAEYQRVYNRLKTQKSRGKISVDEWNLLVAQALDLKDRAQRGQLTDEEMKGLFEGMGR